MSTSASRKRFPIYGRVNFELRADVLNLFNNINFTPVFNPGTAANIFEVTAAYTDASNTFDPGGRLGQLVLQTQLVARNERTDRRMLKAFRDFAVRGNVIDMAVGIIIGAAFGTIVKSLVDDVLMPPIGLLLGGVDMTNLFVVVREGRPARAVHLARRRQGRGSRHDQLRALHQRHCQLRDRRVFGVSAGESDRIVAGHGTPCLPAPKTVRIAPWRFQ